MPAIDYLDEQILEQLFEDGRKSFVEIGKACNTPYEVIIKRYKEMKKKGIIIGATTQVNYRFFGFNYMGIVVIDTGEKDAEELKKFIQTIPNVISVLSTYKKYSITAIVKLTNIQELDEIKDKIKKQSPTPGLTIYSNLWVEEKNMPENLFLLSPQREQTENRINKKEKTPEEQITFDDLDIQLIDKLSENGRQPFSEIAEELKSSVDTIIRRYDKLKKNKVLKVIIRIDPKKIGYQANAVFLVSLLSQGSIETTINSLSKMRNIVMLAKLVGEADIFLLSLIKDFNEYFSIRNQISKLPFTRILRVEIDETIPVFPFIAEQMSSF